MRRTLQSRLMKNGVVLKTQELGKANSDEYDRISIRVFNENRRKNTLKADRPQTHISIFCKETDKRLQPAPLAQFVKLS